MANTGQDIDPTMNQVPFEETATESTMRIDDGSTAHPDTALTTGEGEKSGKDYPNDENNIDYDSDCTITKDYDSDHTVVVETATAISTRAANARGDNTTGRPTIIDLGTTKSNRSRDNEPIPNVPIHPSFIINEKGVFAINEIPQGGRIMAEDPLILIRAGDPHITTIIEQFHELTYEEKEFVMSLPPEAHKRINRLTKTADRVYPWLREIFNKPQAKWTSNDQLIMDRLGPLVLDVYETWAIAARFYTHSYYLTETEEQSWDCLPVTAAVIGLFEKACRIRHSCVPNTFYAYNNAIGRLTIHATKKIHPGDEITVNMHYWQWYHDVEVRQDFLGNTPTLGCLGCEACDVRHPNFLKHHFIRSRLQTSEPALKQVCQELEVMLHSPFNLGSECPPVPTKPVLLTCEQRVLELIKLLRDTGCEDMELIKWRERLIYVIFPSIGGKSVEMAAQAGLSEQIALRCMGADNPMVDIYRKLHREARQRAHINMAMARKSSSAPKQEEAHAEAGEKMELVVDRKEKQKSVEDMPQTLAMLMKAAKQERAPQEDDEHAEEEEETPRFTAKEKGKVKMVE